MHLSPNIGEVAAAVSVLDTAVKLSQHTLLCDVERTRKREREDGNKKYVL